MGGTRVAGRHSAVIRPAGVAGRRHDPDVVLAERLRRELDPLLDEPLPDDLAELVLKLHDALGG